MWEFVDKVVYINLDHREDRRQIMQKLFDEGKIPSEKIERFSAIKHDIGIIGCAMGHISILKFAKAYNWKNVLILEDDLCWTNFEENYKKLEQLVSKPFDVCMLGGLYLEFEDTKINAALCTNAYIVSSHYYDTLLANFEYGLKMKLEKPRIVGPLYSSEQKKTHYNNLVNQDNIHNVDVYWMKLQMKDNWIGVSMIDQVDCYSDIYNKTMFRDKEYNSRIIPILINNLVNPMKNLIATNSI
jgi:hypothetical protein